MSDVEEVRNRPRVIHPGYRVDDDVTRVSQSRANHPSNQQNNNPEPRYNYPTLRQISSGLFYFIGIIVVCIGAAIISPAYLTLAIGLSMVVTGILLGLE